MELSSLLAFLGAAIILTIMPGPDNLFVLAQSITQDKKAGIATSLGLCTGLLVHIGAAVLGLSHCLSIDRYVFDCQICWGCLFIILSMAIISSEE